MSDFQACKTCGRYGWTSTHVCPPVFECRIRDFSGVWFEVRASSADEAAEKAAETWDEDGEYSILRNGYAVVEVRTGGDVKTFGIEAESRPHYSAHERQPESPRP